jgi:XapX domain-containing protein
MSVAGIVAALLIGVGCRLLGIPSPAPPKLQGALLVVAMTLGYLLGGRLFG